MLDISKRKFFSVSLGMFVIGSGSQSAKSDAEASDGREAAAASTARASRSSRDDTAVQSGESDAEASDGSSIAKASSTDAASEMSEEEYAEDALLVVVDPQKKWTTMEDRCGRRWNEGSRTKRIM